jgi:hypothetical protein
VVNPPLHACAASKEKSLHWLHVESVAAPRPLEGYMNELFVNCLHEACKSHAIEQGKAEYRIAQAISRSKAGQADKKKKKT